MTIFRREFLGNVLEPPENDARIKLQVLFFKFLGVNLFDSRKSYEIITELYETDES